MFVTTFMGLIAWDQGSDPYDHAQLANNFQALDSHDHTTSKGRQIPSGGLQDGAVVNAKIAPNAVTPDKIPDASLVQAKLAPASVGASQVIDGAIGTAELADGATTFPKLSPGVAPIGQIIMWTRVDPSVPVPTGWEILDGRAWSVVPNKMGPGGTQWTTGNMPNFINAFPLGATPTGGAVNDYTQPPGIGMAGGSHSTNLAHGHTVNAHSHGVLPHTHPIASDGDHWHAWESEIWDSNGAPIGSVVTHAATRDVGVPVAQGTRQSLYVPGLNKGGYYGHEITAYISTAGVHDHGSATLNSASTFTQNFAPGTDSQLGTVDTRPKFVGVLFLIRVL